AEFYARRIKRLLPALLLCVLVTSLLFVLLTTRPAPTTFHTGAWALVGAANIALFRNSTDYFSLDARLNPFTHTWSLGVEEQFYLFFPLLVGLAGLAAIGRRPFGRRPWLIGLLTIASLAGFVLLGWRSPTAMFYLSPGRFWELGIGSLAF